MTEDEKIALVNKRWKYRRAIALISFGAIILVLTASIFGLLVVETAAIELITYIIGGLFTVVLAYQGLAVGEDITSKWLEERQKKEPEKENNKEIEQNQNPYRQDESGEG